MKPETLRKKRKLRRLVRSGKIKVKVFKTQKVNFKIIRNKGAVSFDTKFGEPVKAAEIKKGDAIKLRIMVNGRLDGTALVKVDRYVGIDEIHGTIADHLFTKVKNAKVREGDAIVFKRENILYHWPRVTWNGMMFYEPHGEHAETPAEPSKKKNRMSEEKLAKRIRELRKLDNSTEVIALVLKIDRNHPALQEGQ